MLFRLVLFLAIAVFAACSKTEAPEPVADAAPVADAPPPPPTPAEVIRKIDTLARAIDYAMPKMTDTVNDTSEGSLLLLLWAMDHMKFSDVGVTRDETSYPRVQKDPDEERGKRLCQRGVIIQIEAEKIGSKKIFDGILMSRNNNLFKFLTVGSTGDLVQGSYGRVCGVVTGKYTYSNSGGGTGHAIQLVGMFDLPENRQQDPTLSTARSY